MFGRINAGMRRRLGLKRQRGFTLVEVLMAVAIGSLVLSSGAKFMLDRVNDVKDQTSAQYQKAFTLAAERYVRDNLATISGGLAINGNAMAITLPTIRAAGYISNSVANQNPYAQTPCLLVRRLNNSASGQPRVEALVVTEGGTPIPDRRVPFVAAQGGSVGGFVPPTAPTTAQGAYGVWANNLNAFNMASCSGTPVSANRLAYALYFDGTSGSGVNQDDVLHRVAVAGRPDLNRMNVALDMGGNNINNALNVTATGTVTGAYVQANGEPTYGQTVLRTWGLSSVGDIYLEPSPGRTLYLTDQWSGTGTMSVEFGRQQMLKGHTQFSRTGAVECCGDQGTIGVAENTVGTGREAGISFHNSGQHEGNLVLANTALRGGVRRLMAFDNQGQMMGIEATGAMYAEAYIDRYDASYYVRPRSWSRMNSIAMPWGATIQSEGRLHLQAAETLYLQPWPSSGDVYVGGGGGSGNMNVNDIYVRSKGRWLSELLPNWVLKGTQWVGNWWGISKPACGGGTPRILLTILNYDQPEEAYFGAGAHAVSSLRAYAHDYGTYWQIELRDVFYYGNGGVGEWGGSGIAQIYCAY